MSCTPVRQRIRCEIPEGASADGSALLKDQDGNPITQAMIDSLVGTLYDEKSGEILNERDHVDVFADLDGAVDAEGELTLKLNGDDNAIVDDTRDLEQHILLLEWTWTDPDAVTRDGKAEIAFIVRNLAKVPQAT